MSQQSKQNVPIFIFVMLLAPVACAEWFADSPCFSPGRQGAFDSTAVKDPTIVRHDGLWHLFYTARGNGTYSLGYTSAATIEKFNGSERHELKTLSKATGYAAAPQVFYFAPQRLWYLVYQTHGLKGEKGRYTPMYATSTTIADPDSWSTPQVLAEKFERDKWIDFWVICDDETAYLFYTRNHEAMYYMTTPLARFPEGFGEPTRIEGVEVHEAVCVYKIEERNEYAMLLEINDDGRRAFKLSRASKIRGPWSKAEPFAHGDDLVFGESVGAWTKMVSHGELIRSGVNQKIVVKPLDEATFLIQGTTRYEAMNYAEIVWQLGVIRNFSVTDAE